MHLTVHLNSAGKIIQRIFFKFFSATTRAWSDVTIPPILPMTLTPEKRTHGTLSNTPGNHTLFLGEVQEAKVLSQGHILSSLDYDGIYLGKS